MMSRFSRLSQFAAAGFFALSVLALPLQAQGLLQKAQQADAQAKASQPQMGLIRAGELQAALVSEKTAIVAGEPLVLGLRLLHDKHWHTYWRNPGDSGLATSLEWRLPGGFKAGEIQWPAPQRIAVGPLANFGYEGDLLLPVEITVPKNIAAGKPITISVKASWLVCKDVCIPGDAYLGITLPVAQSANEVGPSENAGLFAKARLSLPVHDADRAPKVYLKEKSLLLAWSSSVEREPTGFFFPYLEGLITPAAAQSLSKTKDGWMLEVALGESARQALQQVRAEKRVQGIWVVPGQRAREWRATLALTAPPAAISVIDAGQTASEASPKKQSADGPAGLLIALAGAILGGLILNLMPCVFPVIGLKVLSFAQTAHSRTESVRHAFIFSLGVVLSFVALALMLVALRAAGEAVGWGFQLQNPLVVLLLALLFVGIAVNLFGVFEFGLMATRLGNLEVRPEQSKTLSAFSSGVLAVVVASPCTAPFMGSAIGFTATAGVAATLLVFAAVGVGMAIPYVVLSIWPGFLSRLPKPGPWMVRFKEAMAFPMLAAAGWLFWVLATLQGADVILSALIAAVSLGLLLWIYGAYIQPKRARITSWVFAFFVFVILLASSMDATRARTPIASAQSTLATREAVAGSEISWRAWQPGLAEQLQAQGKTVFVDFTASWCISCQANKVRVLQSDAISRAFSDAGVIALRADWTRKDAQIAGELARHGRNGVPLYLVYPKTGGAPKILSEWLTEKEVINAIR